MKHNINEKILQYQNIDTKDYSVKAANNTYDMKTVYETEEQALQEYDKFKEKLKIFENVKSVSEAKKIAKDILPINNEINYLVVGKAKCVVISRHNMLRIVLKGEKEVICYNFRIKENLNDRN